MIPELPQDRLATTDETGKRVYLYPAAVKGRFKGLRNWVHSALVLFFLILPWIHLGGRQLLLLDVARREFFFFGLHFRAHDAPLLIFLLLSFAFLIGLITALWGRLWCGWACPQTVFIESVFRRIEGWIEGSHRERKALDEGPWDGRKFGLKAAKYSAFLAVTLVITHSFLAYFVGSRELVGMVTRSPVEHWESFLVIIFTSGIILFDFGWFREQFCVIVCPYGRFQSVMIDSHSLIVGYDTARGEPRRGTVPAGATQGDCVDCRRCVQVCPTGIDIRRGLQMECIGCTACIDACDEVMTKTKKPLGLIRYTSLAELKGRKRKLFGLRPAVYSLLLAASVSALVLVLGRKEFLDATILRATEVPYQVVPEGDRQVVINHFKVDLSNQTGRAAVVTLSSQDPDAALVMPMNPLALGEGANSRADFFLKVPVEALEKGSRRIPLLLRYEGGERTLEVIFVGPGA